MKLLDFRSDTLTQPTLHMREHMAKAAVGDAFYDEDPSVEALQSRVAELFGHEAALFVPSGTMSNQIALQLHCRPGEGVFCAPDVHILRAESGAMTAISGLQSVIPHVLEHFMPCSDSMNDLFVAEGSLVAPPTKLLALENTHLFSGGRIHPWKHLEHLSDWCRNKGVATHLDGARIWHAHIETGISLRNYGTLFESISVCFSKGLGAPVGSCLVASREKIRHAKLLRKRLGGSMRQCGILAAGASWALEHHLHSLKEDHSKAKQLAAWLKALYPEADIPMPETNIVLMKFNSPSLAIIESLKTNHSVLFSALNPRTLRAVCHRDIHQSDLDLLTRRIDSH